MRGTWLVVAVALAAGCKGKDEGEAVAVKSVGSAAPAPVAAAPDTPTEGKPAKKGSLKREPFAMLSVIVPPGVKSAKLAEVAKATGDVETHDATPQQLGITAEAMQWYGGEYPPADRDKLLKATYVLSIASTGPDSLARVGKAAIATAKASGGWILNPHSHQIFTAETIVKHLPGDGRRDVRELIVVHQVGGEGELAFLDTAGLIELGLPELFVPDVPPGRADIITAVVNATAQTLLDHGDITRDGVLEVDLAKLGDGWHSDALAKAKGTGKIAWQVTWGRGDEDPKAKVDPEELELHLTIAGSKPGTSEVLVAAVESYLGAVDDRAKRVDFDDELAVVAVKAREALAALEPKFAKGFTDHRLAVKAPFKTDSGNIEWMWVDVLSFKGAMIDGVLNNSPDDIKALKLGMRVKVKFAEVADFILVKPDGTKEGGFSLEVMRKHGMDVPPL